MTDQLPTIGSDGGPIEAVPVMLFDPNAAYAPAIPVYLLTGIGQGDGAIRLRVDPASTGFFAKREYTLSVETNIPAGEKQLIRFVSTGNFIVTTLAMDIDAGATKLTTWSGGTPTGTFSDLTPRAANTMTEGPVTPAATMAVSATAPGGAVALTGGTQIDVLRIVAANATAQASTIGAHQDSYRGRPAGTYYVLMENIDGGATTGVFRIRWEQR